MKATRWDANASHVLSSVFPRRENVSTPSRSRWRNSSILISLRSTPTTAKRSGSHLSRNRLYSAGTSLRQVRSPAAPNMTPVVGSGWIDGSILHSSILCPLGVEGALGVHPLVGMGAEVVALGLDQVCRQPGAAIAIEVCKRSHQRRRRDARL